MLATDLGLVWLIFFPIEIPYLGAWSKVLEEQILHLFRLSNPWQENCPIDQIGYYLYLPEKPLMAMLKVMFCVFVTELKSDEM